MIVKIIDAYDLNNFGADYGNDLEYSISEGGWISKDRSTIVITERQPYKREVIQYLPYMEKEYHEYIRRFNDDGIVKRTA